MAQAAAGGGGDAGAFDQERRGVDLDNWVAAKEKPSDLVVCICKYIYM